MLPENRSWQHFRIPHSTLRKQSPIAVESASPIRTGRWRKDGGIFLEKRGDLIVNGLLYSIICLVAALITFNDPLLPLFFSLVAGLSILGPAAASGFYELARRR